MARIAIELDWERDLKGYHLAEVGRTKMLRIVRNGTGHGHKDLQPCRPLDSTDLLFKLFANIATTPEGVLDFVQRYGPLTWEGNDEGDPVRLVMFNADHMRQVLRFWDGDKRQRHLPAGQWHSGPASSLDAMVVWDPTIKALRWELRPRTLLDALWLQLGQALTADAQFRQCEHCGDWFEAGRGTGRRLDARFCSDEHRVAYNSLKRSKKR